MPEDFHFETAPLDGLQVESSADSLALIQAALTSVDDERSVRAARLTAMNAGAAIYVAGLAASPREGCRRALEVIADGTAWQRLEQLAAKTQSFA
jgi:anthranilate phosphoribosyltransferase